MSHTEPNGAASSSPTSASSSSFRQIDHIPTPARYEFVQVIGHGGMAVVHKVRDPVLGKVVALKRLIARADESQHAKSLSLFEREYHVLSQLAHPRVVEVYDYGVDAHGPYYTMELLDGGDLHALAPVPWQRACSLMREVCSALSLVHSRRLVHRDISPRNVRCTSDGMAKLLDFGAMVPMGPVKQIVGTPPICAPELLDMEPLDARSDLYSLGATLYYALVGHHAYPARDFRQLRQLWTLPLAPPSAYVAGIPAELDGLVMSLLSLDPAARPVSAAEVMDRLATIAQLPPDDLQNATNAYLYAPSLVGRTDLLERAHRRFSRAEGGRGSATMLLGPSGVGRTRLFAACLLDAKLLGMTVLRVDASDGQRDYGGVRAVARQLLDNLHEATLAAAEPRAAVLAHAIPELLDHIPGLQLATFEDPSEKRPRVQQALREWLSEICKQHPIVLGIDDVDLVDEPTKAFSALLIAEIAEQPLALLVTARPELPGEITVGAMKLLRELSTRLSLANLTAAETEELVVSIFSEGPNRQALAHKLYAISSGNPRDIIELARHLIDRAAIRYEAGAWSLPAKIDSADLPDTIAQAHRMRIDALSDDSRALAQTLAFEPALSLSLDEIQALCGHDDSARMLRSIDELLRSGVLQSLGRNWKFAQPELAATLREGLSDDVERDAHLRLAAMFEQRGDAFSVAEHLLHAGEEARGVDTLVAHARESVATTDQSLQAYEDLLQRLPDDWFDTYRKAIDLCPKLGRPRRDLYALWMRVSGLTPAGLGDTDAVVELLSQLRHDTGLDIYESLDPSLDMMARLGKSFEMTAARYQATPENERVLEALEALRALGRACIQAVGTVTARLDLELWEKLPSLKPFEPLSPALGVVDMLIQGNGYRITGRAEKACVPYRALLERATQPDRAGLDETHQRYITSGVCFGIGFMEAPLGSPTALEFADRIEADPLHRVNALLIRMLFHLWRGDSREADRCRHQVELMRIQQSPRTLFEGTHLIGELGAHAASDDLVRVKQTIPGITLLAKRFHGWVPLLHLALGESHRIRGGYEQALVELERGLALTAAGRHQFWSELATAHLRTLDAAGRYDEVCKLGEQYIREAEAAELGYRVNYLKMALAPAYAARNENAIAEALANAAIEVFSQLGEPGLNLGLACEARARVAARLNDRPGFSIYSRRCRDIYRGTGNRALIAKYDRLLREARGNDTGSLQLGVGSSIASQAAMTQITGMLSACSNSRMRAKLGLDVMVARSGALGGFLYAVEGAGPVLVAQSGPEEPATGLTAMVGDYLRVSGEDGDTTADTEEESDPAGTQLTRFEDAAGDGKRLRPTLIGHRVGPRFEITGLALLIVDPERPFTDPSDVAVYLSGAWFEAGEVTSITNWLSAERAGD